MKIERVSYHKVFNLGNYSNEKIGIEIAVGDDESPIEAHKQAVQFVEKAHRFMGELKNYQRAKQISDEPMNYRGSEIEQAKKFMTDFEANYPDMIAAYGTNLVLSERNHEPEFN